MRSPSSSIASSVTNSGAVKLIAVKSASGISVNAVNQQNMLAVPANDRIACERNRSVRRMLKPWKCQAMKASTAIEMRPRTKMICPVGTPSPRYLTHAARQPSRTTDDSFRNTPRTGRCWCSFAANAGTSRELKGAHHSRADGALQIRLFLPRGRAHADHTDHVACDRLVVELCCFRPGAERRGAVRAGRRGRPFDPGPGKGPDARGDGHTRAELGRRHTD